MNFKVYASFYSSFIDTNLLLKEMAYVQATKHIIVINKATTLFRTYFSYNLKTGETV